MNISILNREFQHPQDGWYNIEPRGDHPNEEAGVVQVIDDQAISSIVNRFNADADAGTLSHGSEMLIDHEHFSHDQDKETRAFGWLNRLAGRADGIYGKIRWTGTGKAAVDSGDYRFFSTEYDPAQCLVLNRDRTRIRPQALAGLTLTNRPNNRGGKPITNKYLPDNPAIRSAAEPKAGKHAEQTNNMKSIATKLGLSADTSEEGILSELTKLMNRATEAEKKSADLATENGTLKNRVKQVEEAQADSDLDAAGIAADDADRPTLKKALIENRETGLAFLKRITAKTTDSKATKPLTNRADAKTPTKGDPNAKDDEKAAQAEQNRATLIRNRAERKMRDDKTLPIGAAWKLATLEVDQEAVAAK